MYLILKGTTALVRKPNGQTKEHVTKKHVAIPTGVPKRASGSVRTNSSS